MCLTCEQMFTYTTLYIVPPIVVYDAGLYREHKAYAGIRFVLPVKARIVYNYGWNYVQSSVCEHLFTCQAHLFSIRCRVLKSRSHTVAGVFKGRRGVHPCLSLQSGQNPVCERRTGGM